MRTYWTAQGSLLSAPWRCELEANSEKKGSTYMYSWFTLGSGRTNTKLPNNGTPTKIV